MSFELVLIVPVTRKYARDDRGVALGSEVVRPRAISNSSGRSDVRHTFFQSAATSTSQFSVAGYLIPTRSVRADFGRALVCGRKSYLN